MMFVFSYCYDDEYDSCAAVLEIGRERRRLVLFVTKRVRQGLFLRCTGASNSAKSSHQVRVDGL